jgi:hypothetical protein
MAKTPDQDHLSEAETAKRRDAAILRALKTPPQPHKDVTGRKGKSPKNMSPKSR